MSAARENRGATVCRVGRFTARRDVGDHVDPELDLTGGEMPKNGYIDYTRERISGFTAAGVGGQFAIFFSDLEPVPELKEFTYRDTHLKIPICNGPLSYTGFEHVRRDIASFRAALDQRPATEVRGGLRP